MASWNQAVARTMDRAVADLQRLCRQPSVSAQGLGIAETVALVHTMVEAAGGRVRVLTDCGGYPVIYAEFDAAPGGSDRTLLYYNHYDVQPPEPIAEWTSPPFAAAIEDGKLIARGAADNKGELVVRLTAIRLLRENGGLPCRVKFLIEGEEEVGSPSIPKLMDRYASLFAANACIWEFGDVDARRRPQIYAGVKGMVYLQLWSRTANVDLHSSMGAVVESPAWRLVQALATLKDPSGRILVDGFYDGVRPPTGASRRLAAQVPFEADGLRTRLGLTRPFLTEDPAQALCFEPTCTICGLESGYTGAGSKTVLPKEAQAKVDCRLVPGQDPQDIFHKIRRHLDHAGYRDITLELLSEAFAYITDAEDPFVTLVRETAREAWGADPVVHPSSAGTGPMYPIGRALGLPIVSTGSGWDGSRAHAPDESIRVADLESGILHQVLLLQRFAQATAPASRGGE